MSSLSLRTKVFVTVAALGTSAAVAGLGTFGAFTSTTSAATPVSSGVVSIALGATGAATNRLTVGATGVLPGDTMQRSFDLNATGSTSPFASVTLTSTAPTTSSLLDTDATNGLQMVIDKCATGWVESVATPYTYTCVGTVSSVLASRAVIGANLNLSGLASLTTAAASDSLRLTLTLPTAAPNTMQNLSSTVNFAFTANQRAGTSK